MLCKPAKVGAGAVEAGGFAVEDGAAILKSLIMFWYALSAEVPVSVPVEGAGAGVCPLKAPIVNAAGSVGCVTAAGWGALSPVAADTAEV